MDKYCDTKVYTRKLANTKNNHLHTSAMNKADGAVGFVMCLSPLWLDVDKNNNAINHTHKKHLYKYFMKKEKIK